jgi:MFS family permease
MASVASNVGTWMHDVGASWFMTELSRSPFMVALMQTATAMPVFLLALPAGALADIVDRRRLLILTQSWMLLTAVVLGVLALAHAVGPWTLLLLTFSLGFGGAMNAPAWQAIVPEVVSREDLPAAVALGGVGMNLARAVGPALGGLIVAAAGPGAVFLLNAVSFLGVILVLFRWQRQPQEVALPERLLGAMKAGTRYVRHAPPLQAVLIRAAAFIISGSGLWAMLPLLARRVLGLDAFRYGVLLGCLGVGAVAAAQVLPRVKGQVLIDPLIAGATLLMATATATLALVRSYPVLCAAMMVAGIGWMTVMSSFNVAAQGASPGWARARTLGFYLLVFQGGMAVGSILWGAVAARAGVPAALLGAAGGQVLGLAAMLRYRLEAAEGLDHTPSAHWPEPMLPEDPHLEKGPVLVAVEYRIEPARAAEFVHAMQGLQRLRRRDGAIRWGLFHDLARPGRFVETFLVETWAEHLRQHERVTMADREVESRAHAFHLGPEPPAVSHLIAEHVPRNGEDRHGRA